MLRTEDRTVQAVGAILKPTHKGDLCSHVLQAPQSLGKQRPAEPLALVRRHSCHRFKISRAGDIVKPDGAEGSDRAIRRHRGQVEVAPVERGGLNVAVLGRVIPVLNRDLDIALVETQPRGITALEQLQPLTHGMQGVSIWQLHLP